MGYCSSLNSAEYVVAIQLNKVYNGSGLVIVVAMVRGTPEAAWCLAGTVQHA